MKALSQFDFQVEPVKKILVFRGRGRHICARRMSHEVLLSKKRCQVLVLNMANPLNPGGGASISVPPARSSAASLTMIWRLTGNFFAKVEALTGLSALFNVSVIFMRPWTASIFIPSFLICCRSSVRQACLTLSENHSTTCHDMYKGG